MVDKQEPAAWMWDVYSGAGYTSRGIDFYPTNIPFAKHTPLYTAPQREWVDLTATEIKILRRYATNDRQFAELIQAQFKEKNT